VADLFGIPANDLSGAGAAFGAIGSAVSGFSGAAADLAQAGIYGQEIQGLQLDSTYTQESGYLQEVAAARRARQVEGTAAATTGGHGLAESGSALDLLRESQTQSALTQGFIGYQTDIKLSDISNQIAVAREEQAAAQSAASSSILGGVLGAAGKIAGAAAFFA
jgi:hypothetical protein